MSFQQKLIEVTVAEWEWFGKDTGQNEKKIGGVNKEASGKYAARVGDYWLAIPSSSYNSLVKNYAKSLGKLDGTVTALPWSAAFISYCFNQAGAGAQFPYSAGHATWIVKAIKNAGSKTAKLVGHPGGSIPLKIGDVLGKARAGSGVTFANAVAKGWFASHSDIVVEIDKAQRKAWLIGGNVGHSVSKVEVAIDNDGRLVPGSGGYFVHIENRIDTPTVAFTPSTATPLAG